MCSLFVLNSPDCQAAPSSLGLSEMFQKKHSKMNALNPFLPVQVHALFRHPLLASEH